jgi:hypothetical protein
MCKTLLKFGLILGLLLIGLRVYQEQNRRQRARSEMRRAIPCMKKMEREIGELGDEYRRWKGYVQ